MFFDHRCTDCQDADKPACQCYLKSPATRRKVTLQATDHFLCPKCDAPTFGPYWDGREYFDGFYCEAHGTWKFNDATKRWALGM